MKRNIDDLDKFERVSWRPGPEGVPLLDDAAVDAVGFEARGHGSDAQTEMPATVLNSNGWALFDDAVEWAVGGGSTPNDADGDRRLHLAPRQPDVPVRVRRRRHCPHESHGEGGAPLTCPAGRPRGADGC